jgi:hypothetical protein
MADVKQTEAKKARPDRDILIVAMHSGNLSLHNQIDTIADRVRKPPSDARVALLLVDGSEPDLIFPFKPLKEVKRKSAERKVSRLRAASDTVDSLADAETAGAIQSAFKDGSNPRRQCVIIASTDCAPPSDEIIQKLKQSKIKVNVLLVGMEGEDHYFKRKEVQWNKLAKKTSGSVSRGLIKPRNSEKESEKAYIERRDQQIKDQVNKFLNTQVGESRSRSQMELDVSIAPGAGMSNARQDASENKHGAMSITPKRLLVDNIPHDHTGAAPVIPLLPGDPSRRRRT